MVIMNEKMFSGIEKLDEQHKKVVSNLNNLKNAIENDAPKEKILEIIESLNFYTNEHFKYEEDLAEFCNFYRIEELKDAHNDFRHHYKLIKKFYDSHRSKTPKMYALHITCILEDWLKFHFEDIEYEFIDLLKNSIKEGLDISNV